MCDRGVGVVASLCYPVALHLGAVEGRGSAREAFSSTQSRLTTSISIITAATKPLSNSAASAQSSVLYTLSSLHL